MSSQSYYYDLDLFKEKIASIHASNLFIVISLNAQSLNAKIDGIKYLIESIEQVGVKVSAICLQETWLGSQDSSQLLNIDGYNAFFRGKSCSSHGGLCIYVSNSYTNVRQLTTPNYQDWELQSIEISQLSRGRSFFLHNVYRPPRPNNDEIGQFIEEISTQLGAAHANSSNRILCGDFNIDLLKINNRPLYHQYLTTLVSLGFQPQITLPTRFDRQSSSLIDHIFCDVNTYSDIGFSGIFTMQISDHLPCFTCVRLPTAICNNEYIKIYAKQDDFIANVRGDLQVSDYMGLINTDPNADPDANLSIFINTITQIIDRHRVLKTVRFNKRKHKKNPWITNNIIRLINKRDKLHLKLLKTQFTSDNYSNLKTSIRNINKDIRRESRNAKKAYYDDLFTQCRGDMKKTWKNINEVLNRKSSSDSLPEKLLLSNNTCISNKNEIIDAFNSHFSTIGAKIADSITASRPTSSSTLVYMQSHLSYLTTPIHSSFTLNPVSEENVKKALNDLAPKTSTGVDGMSSMFLKQLSDLIVHPLTLFINQSFNTGKFPKCLKTARVKPLFKKGDRFDMNNYRPISLLSSLSKIFEKLILHQLTEYFETNNLLYKSQYGFRKHHSTDHAALELVDRLYTDMDGGHTPLAIFIDLTKAFDCLSHRILMDKLSYYGVTGSAFNLINSYLSGRSQFTECEGLRSSLCPITTGVPQGSNLGPFLFLVYLNDFSQCLSHFKVLNYADDSTLVSSLTSFNFDSSAIQAEMLKVKDWLLHNRLAMNNTKTKMMIFHPPRRQIVVPHIILDDSQIEVVDTFNYLGITLDRHLSWKQHHQNINSKISKVNCFLSKLKNFLPRSALLTIYNSLILCHLTYGILLWGRNCSQVEKMQKRSVRLITNSKYNSHTEPLFKELRLLKVVDINRLQELLFYRKYRISTLPAYFLTNYITPCGELHSYNTRNNSRVIIPRFRHEFFRNNFKYRVSVAINAASEMDIQKLLMNSQYSFKIYFKNKIFSEYSSTCNIHNCYICRNNV